MKGNWSWQFFGNHKNTNKINKKKNKWTKSHSITKNKWTNNFIFEEYRDFGKKFTGQINGFISLASIYLPMNSNCRTLKRERRLDSYDLPRICQFYLVYFEYHDNWWRLTKHWTETQSNVSTRYGPFFVLYHRLAKIPRLLCILLTKEPVHHDTIRVMDNKYKYR